MKRLCVRYITLTFVLLWFVITTSQAAFAIPKAPINLVATAVSPTQVNLTWQDLSTDETTFELERSLNGTTFTKLVDLPVNTVRYQNTALTGATSYWYRVRARNASGVSAYSNIATAKTPPLIVIPKAPTALTATPVSGFQMNLSWTDNATDETAFELERSIDGTNFTLLTELPANTLTFQDKNLTPVTRYWYRILAKNTAGKSAYSNIANATTLQIPPVAPEGLVATVVSQTQINLSWTDRSNNETGFQLERSTDGNAFAKIGDLAPNATTYANSGLTANTLYYYRLRAVNAAGASVYTAVASARTLNIPVPNAPQDFTAVPVAPSLIRLTWLPVTGNPSEIIVERAPGSADAAAFAQIAKLAANATQFDDTTRLEIDTYFYRIKANNAGGSSAYSLLSIVRPSAIITSAAIFSESSFYLAGKTLITVNVPAGTLLQIFNVRGVSMLEKSLAGSAQTDLYALPGGIYIVRLLKGSEVLSRKIALY